MPMYMLYCTYVTALYFNSLDILSQNFGVPMVRLLNHSHRMTQVGLDLRRSLVKSSTLIRLL